MNKKELTQEIEILFDKYHIIISPFKEMQITDFYGHYFTKIPKEISKTLIREIRNLTEN